MTSKPVCFIIFITHIKTKLFSQNQSTKSLNNNGTVDRLMLQSQHITRTKKLS